MYSWKETKQFRKDLKKYHHKKNFLDDLKEVRQLLEQGEILPIKYHNHKLHGNDLFDCHVRPDFVLLYLKDDIKKAIVYVRIGSHAELDI